MNLSVLLFAFISISHVFAEFRLKREEDNTVSLFCQLLAQEATFTSLIPDITWGDGNSFYEFIDIRDELNDSRFFGRHFPDLDGKNLIGIIIIRDFRESDLQNNFKCSETLINGTRVEYPLTIANEDTNTTATLPTIINDTCNTSYSNTSYPRNRTEQVASDTYPHGARYNPPYIPYIFLFLMFSVIILFLCVITTCLLISLFVIIVLLWTEIKEKVLFVKRRVLSRHQIEYLPDTVDVSTNDTSGDSSSQSFYSVRSEAEDLSEPARLSPLNDDISTERTGK